MIELKVNKKGLQFEISVSEELPKTLFGDDVRIKQILLNLLNNAVKYTPTGVVRLKMKGEVNDDEHTVLLIIEVEDTGIGIRKEDMSSLFKGFQRLDLDINRNIEGTGLGLAITHNLVEMMNGEIKVESIYGKGSVFTLYLAQQIVGLERIGDYEKNYRKYSDHSHKYENTFIAPDVSILVVDDNEINLKVVQNLLKKIQVQITTCTSGAEALKLVCCHEYDVIFLDHMMPVMDGIETLKRSKQMSENRNKKVPVIALTANTVSGAKEMYLSEGFSDYISKPIVGNILEEKLAKYIPSDKIKLTQKNEKEEKMQTESVVQEEDLFIDFEMGMKYCTDSEDIYFEILEMFCAQYDEKCAELQRCFVEKDWNNYTVYIHSLKSNSLNIGSRKLAAICLQLEQAGKGIRAEENVQESTEFIINNHSVAIQLYDEVIKKAKEYLRESRERKR